MDKSHMRSPHSGHAIGLQTRKVTWARLPNGVFFSWKLYVYFARVVGGVKTAHPVFSDGTISRSPVTEPCSDTKVTSYSNPNGDLKISAVRFVD